MINLKQVCKQLTKGMHLNDMGAVIVQRNYLVCYSNEQYLPRANVEEKRKEERSKQQEKEKKGQLVKQERRERFIKEQVEIVSKTNEEIAKNRKQIAQKQERKAQHRYIETVIELVCYPFDTMNKEQITKLWTKGKEMERKIKERQLREIGRKRQHKKKCYSSQLFLLCCICLFASLCAAENIDGSVIVALATKPIMFAEDVYLVCTIQTAETPGHMAWIKIPNGETIAVNEKPSNFTKYKVDMTYESTAMNYTLIIKKFSQSDVNCQYRCDSGFLSQAKDLQLNEKDYIAMPEKNETKRNVSISDGYLQGTIHVKSVYPKVYNCNAMFGGEDITSKLQTNNSNIAKDSIFYNSVIEISHLTAKCEGIIIVTCSIGIMRVQLMNQYLTKCQGKVHDLLTVVLLSLLLTTGAICIGIVVFCERKTLKHLCFEQTQKGRDNAASEAVPMNITNLQDTDPEMSQSREPGDEMEFKT